MAAIESAIEHPRIRTLIEQAEESGLACVNLSDFSEAVQELDLDDDTVTELHDEIERRHLMLSDDCGHEAETTRIRGDEFATNTTDALQLFLNEIRRHPLLTAQEEVELSQRIEQGDAEAKERMINSNLRLVVSLAKKYQGNEL